MNKQRRKELSRIGTRIASLGDKPDRDVVETIFADLEEVADEERGVLDCYPDNLQCTEKWMEDDENCCELEDIAGEYDEDMSDEDLKKLLERASGVIDNIV